MATWVDINEKTSVNADLIVYIEQISDNEFKHYFLSGLTLILDHSLKQ